MINEKDLFNDYEWIIGVDEAGRGCLAGPVYAGAVMCSKEQYEVLCSIDRLTDSKKLTPKRRDVILETMESLGVRYSYSSQDNRIIDRINILQASLKAMTCAAENLVTGDCGKILIAVDGNQTVPTDIPQITVVKGDMLFKTIGAASIVAKVLRDRYMMELDRKFPEYGFSRHKGYPSPLHREKIREFGITPFHRQSFKLL